MTTNREQNPTWNVTSTPPRVLTPNHRKEASKAAQKSSTCSPPPNSRFPAGQQKLHQAESRTVPILQQKILQFGIISRTPLKSQRKSFLYSEKKGRKQLQKQSDRKDPPHLTSKNWKAIEELSLKSKELRQTPTNKRLGFTVHSAATQPNDEREATRAKLPRHAERWR